MSNRLLVQVRPDASFVPPTLVPAREGDVGLDLVACISEEEMVVSAGGFVNVDTGVAIKLPWGCWASIRARSSTFARRQLFVMDGTIDSGYIGPLMVFIFNPNKFDVTIKRGDRLAQLVVHPMVTYAVEYVQELPQTTRGAQGFGSTDA